MRKFFLFWKIKNKENALYAIKQCSYFFLFVAGWHILGGILAKEISVVIDGTVVLALALLLLFLKIRIVSILLILVSGVAIFITYLNKIGYLNDGGSNIILAILSFYFAIISLFATSVYEKKIE